MSEIIALLQCLDQSLPDKTTLRRLTVLVIALLAMTGRVTMLGISRWTGEGGSYRTIQRFFNTEIIWHEVMCVFVKQWLRDEADIFLLAGDETVVGKAGKATYGLDRFFSSIAGKPIPGIAFLAFSLISVRQRRASVLRMEQLQKEEFPKPATKEKANTKPKGKPGRPKGSQNKNRRDIELPAHLQRIQELLKEVLGLLKMADIKVAYFVFDGAFGHNNALQMVNGCGLPLISKLRCDAALYFPYEGEQKKQGAHKKYGKKLHYDQIPGRYLKSSSIEQQIRTDIYQMTMWHKSFPEQLNIVVVHKTNLKTRKCAHVVLFCNDLQLEYDKIVEYYRLRFQIEFNFRDAKQFWGLDDFMNVRQRPLYNAANLAMFMVNLSQALQRLRRQKTPHFSVNDLKAHYRGHKYVEEVLKLLPEKPELFLIEELFAQIGVLGSVNADP